MPRAEVAHRKELKAAVEALVNGGHGDPFSILGPHPDSGGLLLRTFQPQADRVWALDPDSGQPLAELVRTHRAGVFEGRFPGRGLPFAYRLRCEEKGANVEFEDPYRFHPILGEVDVYLIAEGTHTRLYEKLGAHPMVVEESRDDATDTALDSVPGTAFLVWAPGASRVSVVGDFNGWDGRRHPMRKRVECGVWELFLPHVGEGAVYKFEIKGPTGELLPLKSDPFAFWSEQPPRTASIVRGLSERQWTDHEWMARRARANAMDSPISIYECHIGSWMRVPAEGNRYLTYRELAERLVPYVKGLGFTHLELLPVSEFPFDGSWGYQPIGLYAPTSRHGTPDDFALFVEACHDAGLGLILDWVPGHFPTDPHGLGLFDGTHLYEHADPRQGFHVDWNTLIYNYGRREVSNFLLSNALYWLRKFHIDGLRVDAVASMLYLNYSRKDGEWVPNVHGGNENLDAAAFIRRLNVLAFGEGEGATTIAEESTAWPGVSRPTWLGGLGFGFKWNMGWMNDTLNYMSHDPVHRKFHHHQLTFGLMYAFSENFILPISHDEVVHGKGSLLGRMPGDGWQKYANLRAYLAFMFTHPGKKLLFMGCEFGQGREWNHDEGLDWHLLDDEMHRGVQNLVRDLNAMYRELPALHEKDSEADGFEWLELHDSQQSVLAYLRRGNDPGAAVVTICNFTPVPRHDYRIGVPLPGMYRERINSDASVYGGSNVGNRGGVRAENVPSHGRDHSLALTVPPLGVVILERVAG